METRFFSPLEAPTLSLRKDVQMIILFVEMVLEICHSMRSSQRPTILLFVR